MNIDSLCISVTGCPYLSTSPTHMYSTIFVPISVSVSELDMQEEDEGYVPNLDALKKVERNIELIYYENPTLAKELQHQVKKKTKTLTELQEELDRLKNDTNNTH